MLCCCCNELILGANPFRLLGFCCWGSIRPQPACACAPSRLQPYPLHSRIRLRCRALPVSGDEWVGVLASPAEHRLRPRPSCPLAVTMASSSSSSLRLMSDLKTMKQNPPEGVSASPMSDENLYVWGGTVFGPDDTAWEGGIYSMRLTFTEQYPDKPPRVRFTSEMVRPIPPTPLSRPSLLLPSASCLPARDVRRPSGGGRGVRGRTPQPAAMPAGSPAIPAGSPAPPPTAVPPEHLPGRHPVHGPDPGQLVAHLLGLLYSDRHSLAADRPQLRQPRQPRGGALVPNRQEAVWEKSSSRRGEVRRRLGPGASTSCGARHHPEQSCPDGPSTRADRCRTDAREKVSGGAGHLGMRADVMGGRLAVWWLCGSALRGRDQRLLPFFGGASH